MMFSLLHFYGGGLSLDTIRNMTVTEVDAALEYMQEYKKNESKRS